MPRPALLLALITLSSTPFHVMAQDRDLDVTVYTGLGLIRDMRTVELAKGRQTTTISRIAAQIDPTSAQIRSLTDPDRVSVLEQRFLYDPISAETLISRYIGKDIEIRPSDTEIPVKGRLLQVAGEVVLRMEDGRVEIFRPDAIRGFTLPEMPKEMVAEPTLSWLVDNTGAAGMRRMEISYLTGGMTWHAEYSAILNENDNNVLFSGWASIENQSGMTYDNASVTIVAGDVNRVQQDYPRPVMRAMPKMEMAMAGDMAPQFSEQGVFEYHAYTLERRATLDDKTTAQLALIPETRIQASRQYVYDGQMMGDAVQSRLRVENRKQTGLGRPIPNGVIRMYQQDAAGKRRFIGEDRVRDLAADETAYLTIGRAFDINGERTQTDARGLSNRSREESFRIVVRNHKKEPVTVKVVEHLGGPTWSIRQSSASFEKLDANTIEFQTSIAPDGESVVTYTVVYRW
jgi:hypothetical protein